MWYFEQSTEPLGMINYLNKNWLVDPCARGVELIWSSSPLSDNTKNCIFIVFGW